jgi:hypothetical protein
MGMPYMSPPFFHEALRPRDKRSGVFWPTLRSKISA